ncbi:MAG TPA: phosphate acyltransferase PlsX [Gammaproteobacteria bacterium]|nr:phosphate acyltransferase PlsX [Gammaproteobacteria bacterium]
MRIAIDAMGGDVGPSVVVDGALVAARHLQVGLLLVGSAAVIEAELARHPAAGGLDVQIADAPEHVEMSESAAAALRRKPRASIRVAVDCVSRGRADAVVSAGHTGASVMAAHAAFGPLRGVDRPALATIIPTRHDRAILLDSGATVGCRPQHLVQFAVLGAGYAKVAIERSDPTVGLLSVGEEETKGNELTREAHQLLKHAPIRFIGNIEGRDVFAGNADVIVCDGFTGNITLKLSEGLVDTVEGLLHDELASTFGGRVGYALSRQAFRRFRRRVDHSEYGGAPLIGLNGLCIVAHGQSSSKAIANAVTMAVRAVDADLVTRLRHDVAAFTGTREPESFRS